MKEFHAVTVGAGIVINASKRIKELENTLRNWLSITPGDPEEAEIIGRARKGDPIFDKILDLVTKEPKPMSPELNALISYVEASPKLAYEDIEVGLYTTDTGVGWFTGMILYYTLRELGFKPVSQPTRIKGWGWGPEFLDETLKDVLDKISRVLNSKRKQGYRVYLNATGGFKPEVTFATLAALFVEADGVYYIHETYRKIVLLPAIPLSIKPSYLSYLKKIEEPVPIDYLKHQDVPIDELERRTLVEKKGGVVKLRKWVEILLDLVS